MTSLTGPQGYVQARKEATSDGNSSLFARTVENRPYFPLLKVDPSNEATVIEIAKVMVSCHKNKADGSSGNDIDENERQTSTKDISDNEEGKVTTVLGGLTNALFKVDLPNTNSSILVRIFGADGIINRDEETSIFSRLCNKPKGGTGGVVHNQLDLLGRFANGRVETWIPNMRQAHHINDLAREGLAMELARQLARLHYGFNAADAVPAASPGPTATNHECQQPVLWGVTESWIEKLSDQLSHEKFQDNAFLVELFTRATVDTTESHITVTEIKALLIDELAWLKNTIETKYPHSPIVFCHNDVNTGNILLNTSIEEKSKRKSFDRHSVCIIDYEYGSINYAMYDVANFNCEHCGGNDNGIPNYELLPSSERQRLFLEEYIGERDGIMSKKSKDAGGATAKSKAEQVSEFRSQLELFEMASNLYWGIWGVLQAAGEVIDGSFQLENAKARLEGDCDLDAWCYLRYGKNRLERSRICKERLLHNGASLI